MASGSAPFSSASRLTRNRSSTKKVEVGRLRFSGLLAAGLSIKKDAGRRLSVAKRQAASRHSEPRGIQANETHDLSSQPLRAIEVPAGTARGSQTGIGYGSENEGSDGLADGGQLQRRISGSQRKTASRRPCPKQGVDTIKTENSAAYGSTPPSALGGVERDAPPPASPPHQKPRWQPQKK